MGNIICHNKGRYNVYSTVSDGFWFASGLTLGQLKTHIKLQYGNNGLEELPDRLERAHEKGHSSFGPTDESLDDFLCCNRAGEKEARLSTEECIKQFIS